MKLILFLSLTIVLIWQVQSKTTSRCPQFWVDATDVKLGCLWFNVKEYMAWANAQEYCRTKNVTDGHLVEIYSQEQQDFLETKFLEFDLVFGIVRDWWIGLTDDLLEGRWLWSFSLLPANYTAWYTGRPTQNTGTNYVVMGSGSYEYTWLDEDGARGYYPICQFWPDD